MPRPKRPKYNLTSSQRRMLRQDPTLYFYSVEASAEPGGAPVCIKRDNPYHGAAAAIAGGAAHGAAAAIADGAAHAITSHGSAAGQQPDVAVSADGHTVLPTAHGPDDHEQHLAVSDAEDIAQSAAEQKSPGCAYSAHNPELPDAVRLDAAAGGSVRPVVDTEITQYNEAMRAYFRADQPPMLRVSQAYPSERPCMRCRRNGTRTPAESSGAGTASPAWPGLRRWMDLRPSCTFVIAAPIRWWVCASCRCSTIHPSQRVAYSPRGVCMHAPCNICSDRMRQVQTKLWNRRGRQVSSKRTVSCVSQCGLSTVS